MLVFKGLREQLNRIERKLDLLIKKENQMNETTTEILAAVEQETTLEQSAITLLNSLQTQLQAALANTTIDPADQANLNTIFADLSANATALSAAITANTPVAPTK